ncbi:MAG: hypothetical protein AUI60_02905 [Thaumarchaeota archaeon 13_1_40CM_2_39_4]|nr:MAG: hypothetical protein AUI60_02905 [Thaumarchaeota archaeon 13_1_40CM_2_39_4]
MIANDEKISINVPTKLISSIIKEFNLSENEIERFIMSTLERIVVEKNSARNSEVFTKAETKEIEDELNGLGYL